MRCHPTTPLADRIWSRIQKTDGCWLWPGAKRNGYGALNVHGHILYVHRTVWELENGTIPVGLYVLHRCDVRACLRPDHLFLGTAQENTSDMITKGRADLSHPLLGENHPHVKLTEADVHVIREAAASGVSRRILAARYSVTPENISAIVLRKTWQHI